MFRIYVRLRGSWTPTDSVATKAPHLRSEYRQWCMHYGAKHVRVCPE